MTLRQILQWFAPSRNAAPSSSLGIPRMNWMKM